MFRVEAFTIAHTNWRYKISDETCTADWTVATLSKTTKSSILALYDTDSEYEQHRTALVVFPSCPLSKIVICDRWLVHLSPFEIVDLMHKVQELHKTKNQKSNTTILTGC